MSAAKVAVIGGGIAGLTVAWALREAGIAVECFEATEHPGGVVRTSFEGGYTYEHGPNTVLASAKNIALLIERLGLDRSVIRSDSAAQDRFLFRGGHLHRLPTGPGDFLATTALTLGGKLRMLQEPLVGRPATHDSEESLAAFVERRLGREALDYLVDPFVSGIHAGDVSRLEVASAFPVLCELEREAGSLLRGMIARRKAARKSGAPKPPRGLLSFEKGLGSLPAALANKLGSHLHLGVRVESLVRSGDGYALRAGGVESEFGEVVIATPASLASRLVEPIDPILSSELGSIAYAPIAVVQLGWPLDAFREPPSGFGFLIPRNQGLQLLGGIYASSLFPGRAPSGHALLSCFIGGSLNTAITAQPPEAIRAQVIADLRTVLNVRGEPSFAREIIWPRAIPQYKIGHGARCARITAQLESLPGLHLAGNYLRGISLDQTIGASLALAGNLAVTCRS